MIKKFIKKQIRKTGTYQVLEIERNKLIDNVQELNSNKEKLENNVQELNSDKEKLENNVQELNSDKEKLENNVQELNSDKEKLENNVQNLLRGRKNVQLLINNLRAENNSIKKIYLERNYPVSSDYNKLTVIIPYRKTDDPKREENVDINLNYLSEIGLKNIIISEHSNVSTKNTLIDKYENLFEKFDVIFSNANGHLFNLACAINKGVIKSKTPYFAIYDMDSLTKKKNIDFAIYLLDKGFEIVYPFNRVIKDIVNKEEFIEDYNFELIKSSPQLRDWADGGIVFWNKNSFINIGMENEYFSGWGGEDNEILIRAYLCKLKQIRIDDILYHLYHDRPLIRTENNFEQIDKIMRIESKEDLLKVINTWPWLSKAYK